MSKSIATNSIYNFVLKVFRLIVPVLVGPYIQRLFDIQLYGAFNDATTWLDFALVFGVFGIYTYGIRELAGVRDDTEKRQKLYSSLFFIGVCTNVIVLICYVGTVWFSIHSMAKMIYLVLGFKIFANIFMVEWLNEAIENYRFITIKTVVVRTLYVIAIFAFIHKPDDVIKYTVIIVLTDIVNNLISFVYINKKIPIHFKNMEIKKHIMPLISILIISNVNLLYTQFDKMMLGQVVDKVAVTIYKTPQDITFMISNLLASIVMVAVPRLAYYHSNGKKKEYMDLLQTSYRSFMLVVFPACVGIACLAKEIMWIYGGGKYNASIPVLIIFAIRTMESSVYMICANQVLYVQNQEKFLVRILLMGGLLNVGLNGLMILLGMYTPVTAIATTLVSEIALMIVIFWFIRNRLGIDFRFFTRTNIKYIFLSLLFIPISFVVKMFGLGVLWDAIIITPICILVYFGALLLLKDPTMLFLSQKVLGKFIKSKK